MSSSNCCFLNCIHISQEASKVMWYSHLFKKVPQFVVIHTVKGLNVINEVEIDVFLEFSCFTYDPRLFTIWFLVPFSFLNPACTSWSSHFIYCWSLAWRILSITLLVCEMSKVAYLTYIWRTSCEMLGWMKHNLESRLPGKVSTTSDMQMILP